MSLTRDAATMAADAHRKVVFMGQRCTGKTSLINRAVDDKFTATYTPTIESHTRVWLTRGDQCVVINIIDSGGLEFFAENMAIPPVS
jgi:GTPase SAR1 family protein